MSSHRIFNDAPGRGPHRDLVFMIRACRVGELADHFWHVVVVGAAVAEEEHGAGSTVVEPVHEALRRSAQRAFVGKLEP